MPTTTSLDLGQTAFMFSWVANTDSSVRGAAQQLADFEYCVVAGAGPNITNPFPSAAVPPLLPTLGTQLAGGDWQLVWGPGVYEIKPGPQGKTDNTAYVVYSKSQDAYIVAIAGTDPSAFQDWFKEDFQVGPNDCIDWAKFSPLAATAPTKKDAVKPDATSMQISLGTAFGIWALASQLTLSQYAPKTAHAKLGEYLQTLTSPTANTRLIFTGHSLGGALSPTLAHWTALNNKNFTGRIFAQPTAGPTPGNQAYQASWDTMFPSTPIGGTNTGNLITNWNGDAWNSFDLVPHAWQYVYTPDDQGGVQPGMGYYLSGKSLLYLNSPLGKLEPGDLLRKIGKNRQTAADAAYMTRSAHTQPFNTIWPIQYYDKSNTLQSMAQPIGPYLGPKADEKFFGDLGMIHVWGYGVSAFGIDFSLFTALRKQSTS